MCKLPAIGYFYGSLVAECGSFVLVAMINFVA
jgi:hypothetical protein